MLVQHASRAAGADLHDRPAPISASTRRRSRARWPQLYGTEHHEETRRARLTALLPDLVWLPGRALGPALALHLPRVAGWRAEHVKVVIGGDGGDELFGGYDRYYGNLYAGTTPGCRSRAPRRHRSGCSPDSGVRLVQERRAPAALAAPRRRSCRRRALRREPVYFYFDAERRARCSRRSCAGPLAGASMPKRRSREPVRAGAGRDPVDRMLYADSQIRLPDHPVMITRPHLRWRTGSRRAARSWTTRWPSSPPRLPPALKVRGGTLRYVQRKLAARYLPPEC